MDLKERLRPYGLTVDRYREILEAQGGVCAICRRLSSDMAVDHNHHSWVIRGIVCRKCNTAIGLLGESIQILKSAISYLENANVGTVPLVDTPRSLLREMLRSPDGSIRRDPRKSGKVLDGSKRGRGLLLLERRGYCERLDSDLYRITQSGRVAIEYENIASEARRKRRLQVYVPVSVRYPNRPANGKVPTGWKCPGESMNHL